MANSSQTSSIPSELLDILRCPQDPDQALTWMTKRSMTALAKKIESGEILNGHAAVVEHLPEAVLVRADGAVGYPVEGGVALLNARDALTLKS